MAAPNYITYKAELVPPIHGMYNAGNTCWQNACTQLLFSLPVFNEFALRKGGTREVKSQYLALHRKYLEQVLPIEVVNKIRAEEGLKPYIAERDVIPVKDIATMLLRAFISDLEIMKTENQSKRENYRIGMQDSPATGIIDLLESFRCEEIYKHFNNRYSVSTICNVCRKVSSRQYDKNPLIEIYSELDLKSQEITESWLRYHKENISDYSCENCKKQGITATRLEELRFLREVVLINWKLPSNTRYYPDTFMMPESNGNTLHYRKVGQIEWSGSLDEGRRGASYASSGHYWASVMRYNGAESWFRVNDDAVTEMKEITRDRSVIVAYHMWAVKPTTPEERERFKI